MIQKIKVIEIKQPPKLNNPLIQQGIRDKAHAEVWAKKNGFTVVYFITSKQKAYGERLTANVATMAQEIEKASADLVAMAEAAA